MFQKIVVLGPQHPDTLPKSVLVTLRGMGYDAHPVDEREVFGFSYGKDIEEKGRVGLSTRLRARWHDFRVKNSHEFELRAWKRIVPGVASHKPDLVIAHSAWIPPETIREIKERTEAKVVSWFPDHPGNLGRQYLFAAPYDALFFKDEFLVDRARSIEKNAFYLPEACMPEWHRPVELTSEEQKKYGCDVTTAGNLYYYRAIIFERIMKKCDVKLWGDVPRWLDSPARAAYQGRSVTELEKSKAFRAARIVVNTFQGEVAGVNQRFFEIAGAGGFQICEHRDAVGKFLAIGKEVVTFRNLAELEERIEYYLAHPEERKKIAEAAQARAHREHTFEQRIAKMLKTIEELT